MWFEIKGNNIEDKMLSCTVHINVKLENISEWIEFFPNFHNTKNNYILLWDQHWLFSCYDLLIIGYHKENKNNLANISTEKICWVLTQNDSNSLRLKEWLWKIEYMKTNEKTF